MNEITANQLFELYKSTLNNCGTHILTLGDDDIAYSIFEEFDIGVTSFLHDNSLIRLYHSELIDQEQFEDSQELRIKVLDLQHENEWNLASIKTSKRWLYVLELADKIKNSFGLRPAAEKRF